MPHGDALMSGENLLAEPFVAGAWGGPGPAHERRDPGDTSRIVGLVRYATPEQVEQAYAAADSASRTWARLGVAERAAVLYRAADILDADAEQAGRELVLEEGKTRRDAVGEIRRSAATLRYYAGAIQHPVGSVYPPEKARLSLTRRFPLGVVAVITPFNYPMLLPAWKVGAALAHGNTVVWKCSELVPFSAARLAAAFAEAGLPDGALNLLPGGADVGQAIVDHPARAAVSFTGSTAVGTAIARRLGGSGARVQLELGGRNPAIVLADADPAFAADLVTNGAVSGSGQKCTAIAIAIVEKPIYDDVRTALTERFAGLVVGHGLDETTDVGPLVSEPARERFRAAVDEAVDQGADVLCGHLTPPPTEGHYVAPTLLHRLPEAAPLLRREVFGPLLVLVPAADADEAVCLANDSEYGLNASIITADLGRALDLADRIEAGMVHVNAVSGFPPHIPFGGIKASGFGPLEQGDTTAEFFTHTRVLNLHPHGPVNPPKPRPGSVPR